MSDVPLVGGINFIEPTITITAGGKAVLVLHPDGRVTSDPDVDADDAAWALIAMLIRHGWLRYAPVWRPIERAPKDGTEFDAWVRTEDWHGNVTFGRITNVCWAHEWAHSNCWVRRITDGDFCGELETIENDKGRRDLVKITHWMPLPAPPEEGR